MNSTRDEAILQAIFNPLLPVSTKKVESELIKEVDEDNEELQRVKQLELDGVHAAEKGDIDTALCAFDEAIQAMPQRASCYNNRAQAHRLNGNIKEAIINLEKAIELSNGCGKSGCQAYIQRGLIRKLQGENELAVEDFKRAADLGSEFAKGQVVQMNPYAAMCNQMLSEVFQQLKTGQYQD